MKKIFLRALKGSIANNAGIAVGIVYGSTCVCVAVSAGQLLATGTSVNLPVTLGFLALSGAILIVGYFAGGPDKKA